MLLIDSWPGSEGEELEFWNKHNIGKSQLALNYALSQTVTDKVPCGGNCIQSHVAKVRDMGAVDALSTWTVSLMITAFKSKFDVALVEK